ncbi:hypothetical protein VM1G_00284 [Cytospora mali]|uniref:Uncharacterized protein n=1 Tax=Cytospora mali TaxID=578113 RepID=A0A194VN72_CYTMA|nr:hypothetical protein VM1G_00284 [Valsa mali]
MSSSSSNDTVDLESAAPSVADNHANPVDSNPHKTESSTLKVDNPRQEQSSERAVHVHRVNHNSSKLPAFRFADRPRDSLGLFPGLPLLSGLLQSDTTNSYSNSDSAGVSNTNYKPQHRPSLLVSSSVSSSLGPGPGPGVMPTSPRPAVNSTLESPHQGDGLSQKTTEPENRSPASSDPVAQHPVTISHHHHPNPLQTSPDTACSTATSKLSPARSTASTIQSGTTSVPITTAASTTSISANQPTASFPIDNSPADALSPGAPPPQADDSPSFCTPATRSRIRRADITPESNKPTSLARRDSQSAHSSTKTTTNECAQGQRGLNLAEAVNGELPYDDKTERRESTSRPPVSYRPPSSSISGRTAIPPIRSFRSSGSRKSPKSDMNHSASRSYGDGDDQHSIHRSRSLRALEGRRSSDWSTSPPTNGDGETLETIESENTAEIFMNIAREDSSSNSRRKSDARGDENQNGPVSRVVRSARQRPFSTAIPSLQNPTSPVQVSRRLSDLTASRTRRTAEDQTSQYPNREVSYRNSTSDRPSLSFDATRARSTVSSLRPSPITPRTSGAHDTSAEGTSIFARRPATSEHTRTAHRQSTGLSKSFNSSPRAPKTSESHPAAGAHHEASESSNSTAAPSTVWDELDELKSRIHRLELTGKMPRTSGAAMSRVSDERPPTAGTGATTLSGSPKRVSGAGAAQTEILSTTSSLRESQPILRSALSKTKSFVSPDIYDAIEAAANDAMSLSQMMGAVGQPGPISSGASTIGVGGSTTVTDRQLRKKTDSICRSLTELCLALTEEGSRRKTAAQKSQPEQREIAKQHEQELPRSPPPMKVFSGAPRRETANADEPVPSIENMSSPRATKLEQRATFNFTGLSGPSALSSPRYASSVLGSGAATLGRKSSLIINRTRRGVTEEPDEQGRKTSLLRTRRAGTDEPEEGRRASYILPPRRVTTVGRANNIDEEPESHFRVPSRAITEFGALRVDVPSRDREDVTRDYVQPQEPSSATSALSRRRLITSNLPTSNIQSSRLTTPTTPSSRRFFGLDRPVQQDRLDRQERGDTSNLTERLAEERGQRQYTSGPSTTSFINRGTSISRKRQSGIPSFSGAASNTGSYR